MFDSHKIEFPDGTQLIIKQDKNNKNTLDIYLIFCNAAIIPCAANHFQIVKINKSVPERTTKKLKESGVIDG